MMKRYDSGLQGERLAEDWLFEQGLKPVARRYRGQDGEIDLIMLDEDTIVFIEVKYRPSARRGEGLLAVTPAKQRRMTHAAMAFLLEREWMDRPVRFDVVEITLDGILHIPNAFCSSY